MGGSGGASGRPTSITLPSGKTTLITYDGAWRKIIETVGANSADAATTQYVHDDAGNVIRIIDPRGKVWTFTFDSLHRRLTATDPLDPAHPIDHTTTWTYDAAGNTLTEKRPDTGLTENTYDVMDRPISTKDPKGETTYSFYGGIGLAMALSATTLCGSPTPTCSVTISLTTFQSAKSRCSI